MKLIPIAPDNFAAVLALNNRHAIESSWLDLDRLTRIVEAAYYACASSGRSAFMIALDQDADYDSPNVLWFRERFARFIYADRIVVDPSGRRQGFDPPNPASDRFHEALGFQTEGEAPIASGKTVRYLSRPLGDPSELRPFGEIP
jgi:predicted GNAT superfamily acetyltransferase